MYVLSLLSIFVFMDWTISHGSGGESYTVGRAESESEVEIVRKKSTFQISKMFVFLFVCFVLSGLGVNP